MNETGYFITKVEVCPVPGCLAAEDRCNDAEIIRVSEEGPHQQCYGLKVTQVNLLDVIRKLATPGNPVAHEFVPVDIFIDE